ncbi:hypothetical protein TREPR_0899 [Treponema primitia ZAS-2]|uniref:Guanylate cyclase domain-containing protein n=1 Tax=Treponema primitia (strain ATCC BAA-887 / DSM 12427 / ZAS-2) TaxID=545694 RepID=F5YI92_TREPZ|nr:hypothetical protein [Treponema primitia]AEF84082.1 hypothetical protein TREPR_0899 [Treponema primitia ZAS-2]
MGYSKGIVYFIDILGSKKRIDDFDGSLKINNIFHGSLYDLETLANFDCGEKYVTSFSDCAYIIFKMKDEYSDDKMFVKYLYHSLDEISMLMRNFVSNKFLCRGGIAMGNLYFDETKNIMFGPAINNVYELEQKAKMPRLIFDDDLAKMLLDYETELKKNDKYFNIFVRYLDIIMKDNMDHRYFLNYLAGSPMLLDNSIDYYARQQEWVKNIIEKEPDHEIVAKYNWHLDFLTTVKNDYVINRDERDV